MLHVVNILALFFLIGSGYVFVRYLLREKITDTAFLLRIALSFSVGTVINLTFNLLFQSLRISIVLTSALGGVGLGLLVFDTIKQRAFLFNFEKEIANKHENKIINFILSPKFGFVFFIGILILAYFRTIFKALGTTDMLLIWASQAKMIYEFGGLTTGINWAELGSWHTDYPKLFQVMSAELMFAVGFWSVYTAKMAMFTLIFGGVLWLFVFYRPTISFLFLLLLILFFIPGEILWDGPMDGVFAIWATVAVLCAAHYVKTRQIIFLYSLTLVLSIAINLKNEGFLLTVCIAIALFVALLGTHNVKKTLYELRYYRWKILILSLLCIFPVFLWELYKRNLSLSNDLRLGEADLITRFLQRLNDPNAIQMIGAYVLRDNPLTTLVAGFGVLCLIVYSRTHKFQLMMWFIAFIAILYVGGVLIIYFTTPNDLYWHLNTSADRVMFAPLCLFALAISELLQQIENIPNHD